MRRGMWFTLATLEVRRTARMILIAQSEEREVVTLVRLFASLSLLAGLWLFGQGAVHLYQGGSYFLWPPETKPDLPEGVIVAYSKLVGEVIPSFQVSVGLCIIAIALSILVAYQGRSSNPSR